jgi:Flp pilus assembly protein TadB
MVAAVTTSLAAAATVAAITGHVWLAIGVFVLIGCIRAASRVVSVRRAAREMRWASFERQFWPYVEGHARPLDNGSGKDAPSSPPRGSGRAPGINGRQARGD